MADKQHIMGIFKNEDRAVAAITAMIDEPWSVKRVHSPIPSEKLSKALKLKKSLVGWFTLAGGILGFFTGFLLAAFTATRWDLIVSGKPVVALVPFFIVGFEFKVLFSVFGNVVGMLTQMGLPKWKQTDPYDERCSGDRYGILATCEPGDKEKLLKFFKLHGGEVTTDGA
jgi:hypothetical protein